MTPADLGLPTPDERLESFSAELITAEYEASYDETWRRLCLEYAEREIFFVR